MTSNQKITPCLWVEKDANVVAEYYLNIFKDGKLNTEDEIVTNMLLTNKGKVLTTIIG